MWRSLYFQNDQIETGVRRLLNSGIVHANPRTGMIEPVQPSMDFDSNWLYFGHTVACHDCYLWHQVMFNHFQLVPSFCHFRCYKVVVKTRNFLEAIQFYNAILAGPAARYDLVPIHGKVGIDERYYTDGHFNGFVYCDGLQEAREKWKAVRELIDLNIPTGPEIPIIIKRSCTEFERAHGPTDGDFWRVMSDDERDLQKHIEDMFRSQQIAAVQPDWLKNKVITKMVRWANATGDKSWIEYFGTDFLTTKVVTYHDDLLIKEEPMKRDNTLREFIHDECNCKKGA